MVESGAAAPIGYVVWASRSSPSATNFLMAIGSPGEVGSGGILVIRKPAAQQKPIEIPKKARPPEVGAGRYQISPGGRLNHGFKYKVIKLTPTSNASTLTLPTPNTHTRYLKNVTYLDTPRHRTLSLCPRIHPIFGLNQNP